MTNNLRNSKANPQEFGKTFPKREMVAGPLATFHDFYRREQASSTKKMTKKSLESI
jgi:hypothetical protein